MNLFDPLSHISSLGEELVLAYKTAQRQGPTPGGKGRIAEAKVRRQLQSLLPNGVGVGTGHVIDSAGNVSAQIDIVIYEEQFCPVFRLENEVNYYPCEAVIAVGEIKSCIGKKELADIYKKIASVRALDKFPHAASVDSPRETEVEYRSFLSKTIRTTDRSPDTIQNSSSAAQIFGFGLGRSFRAKPQTMLEHTSALYNDFAEHLRPNVVVSLDNNMIQPLSNDLVQISWSPLNSPGAVFTTLNSSLSYLIVSLFSIIQHGITSPGYIFEKYVSPGLMTRTHAFIPPNDIVTL